MTDHMTSHTISHMTSHITDHVTGYTYQCFLKLRDVHVEGWVTLLNVQNCRLSNTVEKLAAGPTDTMAPEIPIKEHPGRDDSLVVNVAIKTVVLSVVLAQL